MTGIPKKQPAPAADAPPDIRRVLRRTEIGIIFDVGANIGQSARRCAKSFPDARIYAFEPDRDNFARLSRLARRIRKLTCYRVALSAEPGTLQIVRDASDPTRHRVGTESAGEIERIPAITVDSFCAEHGIGRIDYLKIDTEGHDLEVLKGTREMLASHRVAIVEVECGMNPDNTYHVPFEALKSCLEGHGYRLFRLYDQVREWPTGQPHLRRANAVYLSPRTIAENSD
ncbi:FkbM family methyltransferase [Microvirga sp. 2MCAF35]